MANNLGYEALIDPLKMAGRRRSAASQPDKGECQGPDRQGPQQEPRRTAANRSGSEPAIASDARLIGPACGLDDPLTGRPICIFYGQSDTHAGGFCKGRARGPAISARFSCLWIFISYW